MDMNKKIGPLPLWGWGVGTAVVTVLGIALYRRGKAQTAANAAATSTGAQTGVGAVSPTTYVPPGNNSYYYDVGPETGDTSTGTPATDTNGATPGSVLVNAVESALQKHIGELSNYEQELARDQATNLPNYKANIAPTQAAIAAEQSYIATDIANLKGILSGSLTSPTPYSSGRLQGTTPSGT